MDGGAGKRKLKKEKSASRMKTVGSKYVNMETAYKRSWTFPGRGHFYSGQTGKGLLFSGLGAASLAGVGVFGSTYSSNVDAYNTAQSDYDNLKADLSNGIAVTQSEIQIAAQAVSDASSAKNQAMYSMIGSGVSAAVVWLWNVRDMKKSNTDQASNSPPMTLGINQNGQVQLSLSLE